MDRGLKYVSSGQRNISHITNTQDYKEKTLGYRKAYCRLNIKYRFPIGALVNILFGIRGVLLKFDNIGIIHLVNGVMRMEELCREGKK